MWHWLHSPQSHETLVLLGIVVNNSVVKFNLELLNGIANLSLSSGETRKTFHKNIFLLPFRHIFSLKKLFIMYLLNNKNYLCRKIIRKEKAGGET